MILLSVNFSSCFLHEMKYQETGQAVKIFINCFGLVWFWYERLLSQFLLPSCLSFQYSCTLLVDSEWHLTVHLLERTSGGSITSLIWDHGRDDSGFWKLYQSLKIFFVKQVRNIIASLLTRMNITAVSSRCHKLYGYIRDLTREHLCS